MTLKRYKSNEFFLTCQILNIQIPTFSFVEEDKDSSNILYIGIYQISQNNEAKLT